MNRFLGPISNSSWLPQAFTLAALAGTLPVALLAGMLLLSGSAQAQSLPTQSSPGAVLQGGFDSTTKKPLSQNTGDLQEAVPEESVDPTLTEEGLEAPRLDPSLTRKILIEQIQVEGNTLLSEREIEAIISPFEGRELSLQELQDQVADPLTKAYEDAGYVTSLAFIPPQTIEGGILKVSVQEGMISEVTYEPGRYFKKRAVEPRLLTNNGDVFEVDELLRSMRRINENPDLRLAATLRAGEESGQTRVLLEAEEERFPFHITPFYDNLGRDPVGQQRAGFNVNHNNLLGFGDRFFGSYAWASETFSTINGYEIPVGPHGTRFGVTQAFSTFDFNQNSNNFEGKSNIINTFVKQEFFRNEGWVVEGELGFAVKNADLEANGSELSQDKLRVLTQALTVQQFDRFGRTFMRHELAQGFDLFGATLGSYSLASRPGAGSQFLRYTGSVVRSQRLIGPSYAVFKALGQASPDSLVSLEQFQLGGASTVRGYQEGRLIGDNGFVVSAEARVPMFFLPDEWTIPKTSYRLKDGLELVSFVDAGGAFDNNAFTGVNAQRGRVDSNAYAMSVGFGLRARLTRFINGRIDVGFPLIKVAPNSETARVHFGLESRLF